MGAREFPNLVGHMGLEDCSAGTVTTFVAGRRLKRSEIARATASMTTPRLVTRERAASRKRSDPHIPWCISLPCRSE